MGEHEAIDVVLPAFGPLAVVLPNDVWAVPQNVRHLLEGSPVLLQAGRQGMAEAVRMRVLHAGLLENGR